MHIPRSSLEQLVREIEAVNQVWKNARELFGETSPFATGARALKTCLQIRLLRDFAPDQVYLVIDSEVGEEPLYGLQLRERIAGRTDAAHLPVRVAKNAFTPAERNKFQRR
ncbi:MAG: hypothetical protein HC772_13625 [Leptolyngbyaceae cyanobacterium CRU_2_3]|nr:hypothetical protein [Leptolyngbyaceae cyanobacterium CRU_2_3]